jgi:hypothetical protein
MMTMMMVTMIAGLAAMMTMMMVTMIAGLAAMMTMTTMGMTTSRTRIAWENARR